MAEQRRSSAEQRGNGGAVVEQQRRGSRRLEQRALCCRREGSGVRRRARVVIVWYKGAEQGAAELGAVRWSSYGAATEQWWSGGASPAVLSARGAACAVLSTRSAPGMRHDDAGMSEKKWGWVGRYLGQCAWCGSRVCTSVSLSLSRPHPVRVVCVCVVRKTALNDPSITDMVYRSPYSLQFAPFALTRCAAHH